LFAREKKTSMPVAISNRKFTVVKSLAGVLAQLVERLNGINAQLIFSPYVDAV
jgi:hypothetical protein